MNKLHLVSFLATKGFKVFPKTHIDSSGREKVILGINLTLEQRNKLRTISKHRGQCASDLIEMSIESIFNSMKSPIKEITFNESGISIGKKIKSRLTFTSICINKSSHRKLERIQHMYRLSRSSVIKLIIEGLEK